MFHVYAIAIIVLLIVLISNVRSVAKNQIKIADGTFKANKVMYDKVMMIEQKIVKLTTEVKKGQ